MRFSYCPQCGAPTTEREVDGRPRDECRACSRVYFDNPAPAVGLVLMRDDQILLARRASKELRGAWMIPGGFIESDETVEAAVIREAREELGIAAEIVRLLDASSGFEVPGRPVIGVYYEIRRTSGEVAAHSDIDRAEFYRLDATPELVFDGDRRVLARLRAERAA
jgi:NADH pyrophosphatase NudC (nudix superfamily)